MRRTLAREGFLNSRRVAVSAVVSVGTGDNLSRGGNPVKQKRFTWEQWLPRVPGVHVKQKRRAAGTQAHSREFHHTGGSSCSYSFHPRLPIPDMLPHHSTRLHSVLAIVNH